LKCASLDALVAALQPHGLATPAGDLIMASHDHALQYVGRVIQAPAEIDAGGNVVAEPVFHDGEYAILRAEAAVLDQIAASALEGVAVVEPVPGIPTFGGWQQRPAVDLAALKASRIAEAAAMCEAVLAPYGARYCPSERDTWTEQVRQAEALLSNPALETPPAAGQPDPVSLLRSITEQTGETMAALAMTITRNREAWLILSGIAIGQRQAICDRINAAATPEALAAIDMTITLPAMA
jgi:hypothetical protein